MSIAITCYVASLDRGYPLPPFVLGGKGIPDYFAMGSSFNLPAPDIILRLDPSRAAVVDGRAPGLVAAFQLHFALRQLTQNPPIPTRLDRIALLVADSYAP